MKKSFLIKQTLNLYLLELTALQTLLQRHRSFAVSRLGHAAYDALYSELEPYHQQAVQDAQAAKVSESGLSQWLQDKLPALRRKLQSQQSLLESLGLSGSGVGLANDSVSYSMLQAQWQKCFEQAQPVVLAAASGSASPNQLVQTAESVGLCAVVLPAALLNMPSNALLLVEAFASRLLASSSVAQGLVAQNPASEPVLKAFLSLRLAGPAYYIKRSLLRLYDGDLSSAVALSSVMFEALNRYSLTNKDILLLNQGLTHLEDVLGDSLSSEHAADSTLSSENLSRMDKKAHFELVETLLPNRFAFTEKQFEQSQRLLARLQDGVLISALPQPHHPEVLEASLEELLRDELSHKDAMTPLLAQFTEQPATAVQILTAGTFYELNMQPELPSDFLGQLLDSPALSPASLQLWTQYQAAQQQCIALLNRSLSIAQIHEALAVATANEPNETSELGQQPALAGVTSGGA